MHHLLSCGACELWNIKDNTNVELIIPVFFIIWIDAWGLNLNLTLHAICQVNRCNFQLDCFSQVHHIIGLLTRVLVLQEWSPAENYVEGQWFWLVMDKRRRVLWPAAQYFRCDSLVRFFSAGVKLLRLLLNRSNVDVEFEEEAAAVTTLWRVFIDRGQESGLMVVEEQDDTFVITATCFNAIACQFTDSQPLVVIILLEGQWLL